METYEITADNGWKYNVRASTREEAYGIFVFDHPDLVIMKIQNEDEAIMESLDKGFE